MAEQDNTNLVRQGYEDFKNGNIQAVLDKYADSIEWHVPKMEGVPFSGTHRGKQAVGQFFAKLAEEQDVVQFEPREFIAQNDKVVTLGHYIWRVKATGRQFESDFAHVFTVRDGKIIRFQEYTDTFNAANAYKQS
ncbi:MAG: nuclear transport factor 2 family protein [Bacteroidota bacterium]|nr:nuclear transport factor 2 family protein [Bacteroidota bacterium]